MFLGKNKILHDSQFGFRKNQQYTEQLDEGNLSCGVFTDLQKAFDTVNHKILLKKLESYGFRGVANEWFSTYLSNRKQYVHIPGEESSYRKIKRGVPQGSVLGPILFLLYINDLSNAIFYNLVYNFADDTAILYTEKDKKKTLKHV